MAQATVNFRMDETLKRGMEQACKDMGMSMTTAFTIFATKVNKEQRIPFEISTYPTYDAFYNSPESIAARDEALRIIKDPTAKSFKTMEALLTELENDGD